MLVQKLKTLLLCVSFSLCGILLGGQTAFGQQSIKQTIDLKNIKTLQAELQINAGTFKLTTQEEPKMDASFTYTQPNWKPVIKFTAANGTLSIKQPEEKNTNMQDKDRNDWNIKLARAVPTNLKFRMGAGEGTIDLSQAKLNRLEIEAGAGEFNVNLANTSIPSLKVSAGVGSLTINLTGNRTQNLDADISGGIGDLNLVLPRKVGVRVKASGLGSIESGSLRKQGGYYINDAYGKTTSSLNINVSAGLGSIKIELE